MKPIVHLGDLHLGVKFHKRNLISDQRFVLQQIADWIISHDANLIVAGDVFDTVNPPVDAQELWFSFLMAVGQHCAEVGSNVWVIAGNHDSAARLGLGSSFLESHRIHILRKEELYRVFELEDGWRLFCVPFVKPSMLEMKRNLRMETYDDAYAAVVQELDEKYKLDEKSVLVAHQTFEGGKTGESEFKPFMSDAVSDKKVAPFRYVLSGHLHARQQIRNIYYSGSLLPYAFGDEYQPGFMVWKFEEGFHVEPFQIKHRLITLEGDLSHCLSSKIEDAYVRVKLKNCVHFEDALARLQEAFPLLCCVTTDSTETWEADLNKELQAFSTVQEALDAFCAHLEIPEFGGVKKEKIQEALDAFTESQD